METPFSDPSKPNFSRDMREKGRYDDDVRHFRRRHGGAEVGDGRISAARVSAGSRGEARFILLVASHDGGSEGVPQLVSSESFTFRDFPVRRLTCAGILLGISGAGSSFGIALS